MISSGQVIQVTCIMWVLRYFQVMSFVLGAFLVVLAVRNAKKGFASRHWPQAPGIIVHSSVLVHTDADGEGYTPRVEYEYSVDGTKYRGVRLRYGQTGSWNRGRAERVIAPYPPGSSVLVFFNLSQPADAVLVCGTSWGNIAIAFAGVLCLAVCAALLIHDTKYAHG